MSNHLTPLVDFSRTFLVELFDPAIDAYGPATTGTVTCYIALEPDDESPADPALTGTATYIGANGTPPTPGKWFFGLDASVLTFVLLDSLFLSANGKPLHPYFVILKPNGTRTVEKLNYVRYQKVTAA